jgi:phage terminase small subunit
VESYAAHSARVTASRLLAKANISAALAAGQQARQVRTQRTADDTVHAIACLAFSDIRKFYDAEGRLKPIHALPDDLAACVASIEVVKRNFSRGDGKTEFVYKIKLKPAAQARARKRQTRYYVFCPGRVRVTTGNR